MPILSNGPDSVIVKPKAFAGIVNFIKFLVFISYLNKKSEKHEILMSLLVFIRWNRNSLKSFFVLKMELSECY